VATSTPNAFIASAARRHGAEVLVNPVVGGGIAVDWNFALGCAQADLVTLAHQDDLYAPAYAERMITAMARQRDALIGFSNSDEVGADGVCHSSLNVRVKRQLTRRAFGTMDAIGDLAKKRKLLSLGNPVCCPSVVFNRTNLGPFEFRGEFKSNLDWDAWLRLAERPGFFVYVSEVLTHKRNHGHSETAALIGSRRRMREDQAMFERIWPRSIAALIMLLYRLGYVGNEKRALAVISAGHEQNSDCDQADARPLRKRESLAVNQPGREPDQQVEEGARRGERDAKLLF
jgi:hypothetical protein